MTDRPPMRILLASPRGFCAGVNMAIESLQKVLERFGPPVYVYHEIVHNRWVVEHFRQQGVVFVDAVHDVPLGSPLLYSAHGVSPQIRREAAERNLRTFDATCPLVMKVHRDAIRLANQGFSIVLIGHAGHDEVVGTMGEAPESITLVEHVKQIEQLEIPDPEKIAYLAQTTLSMDDAASIVGCLRKRFPKIVGPSHSDICYATRNRQEAVRTLAEESDVSLVVGSQNSSNSQRLAELARSVGIPAYLIDGPTDIRSAWFIEKATVLVTAGASAPEQVVEACLSHLQARYTATVEERTICEEGVRFPLPLELR